MGSLQCEIYHTVGAYYAFNYMWKTIIKCGINLKTKYEGDNSKYTVPKLFDYKSQCSRSTVMKVPDHHSKNNTHHALEYHRNSMKK